MSTAITALSREQKEVFDSMPKAWQAKATRAIDMRRKGHERDVWEAYELGEIVASFTENERNYGEAAVPNLGIVMDERVGLLWACRQFVGTYNKAEVTKLLERSLRGGKLISFSHFDKLSGLEGKNAVKVRKELESAIITERLSVDDLAKRIQRKMGGKRSSGGRAPNKPKSINSGISQMVEAATKYENRFVGWEEVVFTGIAQAGADQINADLVRHLEEGKKASEVLKDRAEVAIANYDKALTRARSVLENQKTAASVHGTNGNGTVGKKKVKKKKAAAADVVAEAPKKKVVKKVKKKVGKRSVADRIAVAKKKRRPVPA